MSDPYVVAWLNDHWRHKRGLRSLIGFLATLGKGPLDASAEDLRRFSADGMPDLAPSTRRSYWVDVRTFYRRAFADGRVSLPVVVEVGADPLEASPDHATLSAYAASRAYRAAKTPLRRLAGYFGALGKGPSRPSVEELVGFFNGLRGLAPRSREKYLHEVEGFYDYVGGDALLALAAAMERLAAGECGDS